MDFCYKGGRDYVHGTDIFNELSHFVGDVPTIDCVFHGIARQQLIFSDRAPPETREIKVVCIYEKCNKIVRVYGTEREKIIDCHYDFPEDEILNGCELDPVEKHIVLLDKSRFSFIENVVAMNKKLLKTLFDAKSGKWFLVRIKLDNGSWKQCEPGLTVRFSVNFNFRLIRSDILYNQSKLGEIYFSLIQEVA